MHASSIERLRGLFRAARTGQDLRACGAAIHDLAHALLVQDTGPVYVTRLVTALNDDLTRVVVAREITPAVAGPIEICWIVMGSAGRFEQTLSTDQDNGIVFRCAGRAAEDVRATLLPAAQRVNAALAAAGFGLCRGGIMAGVPQCCLSLAEWKARFADWIDVGDPPALLNATIFFDFRALAFGVRPLRAARGLGEELREWLGAYAAGNERFLVQMTRNALENRPPLGLLHDFILPGGADHPHTLDLKVNGITPFVDAARVYALQAAAPDTSTVERLRTAGARLGRDRAAVEAWVDAFAFIQAVRLRHQDALRLRGEPVHNHIDPGSLNELQRRILRESMRQARRLQSRLASDHSLGPSGIGA
jgi:CBS domain-containing protein